MNPVRHEIRDHVDAHQAQEVVMAGGAPLEARETTYRQAARIFDYFMTFLAAVFFLASGASFRLQHELSEILNLAATVLFALALITGIRKLEAYITILGSEYSIVMTQSGQSGLSVQDSAAVLKDLGETVEKLSYKAAVIHRVRNWCFALGVMTSMVAHVLEVVLGS